jgi:hypothetical protein
MSDTAASARHIDEGTFGQRIIGIAAPYGTSGRAAIIAAMAVSCLIFYAASQWLQIPQLPGFDGSLLHQPSPVLDILAIAILLGLTTIVGTLLAGSVRFEAGLCAALTGLTVISIRSGTIRNVLFDANGNSSVYVTLIFETVILGIILGGVWVGLWMWGRAGGVGMVEAPGLDDPSAQPPLSTRIGALATHFLATALILALLCQSEAKNQAFASVGLASLCATLLAYPSFPCRPSFWFWISPLAVGVLGYALAAAGQDGSLATASPQGFFAGLARPLPLDYASVGPAGAIIGYWMMHKHPSPQDS